MAQGTLSLVLYPLMLFRIAHLAGLGLRCVQYLLLIYRDIGKTLTLCDSLHSYAT